MTEKPFRYNYLISLGDSTAIALAIVFYLFKPLERLVGGKAIGLVLALVIVGAAAGYGYLGCFLPTRLKLALGLIGWLAVIIMLAMLPYTVK